METDSSSSENPSPEPLILVDLNRSLTLSEFIEHIEEREQENVFSVKFFFIFFYKFF